MKKVGVAILGLGVVGGGTYKILTEHREQYKKSHGVDIVVESVLEINRQRALALGVEESKIATSIEEICSNPEVDIVIEVMGGVEPAKAFVLLAINAGKSVVTSNKELFCKYSYELERAAKRNHVGLFYEASCVGGVPVIRAILDNLQGNEITSIVGIINGTTNYILTKMTNEGSSYGQVLCEAQKLGYAEADPTSDVDGFDATYKLSILSSLCFRTKIPYTEIYREGISNISPIDIQYGKGLGYVLKLLAIGKKTETGIEARVHPTFIRQDHPLARVDGSFNAVYITGDSVEDVMLYGKGAGASPTGSAIVGDVIYCATHAQHRYSPFDNTPKAASSTKFIKNFRSAYYIRLSAEDRAGELSKLTSILGKNGISVAQVKQEPISSECKDGKVPLIIVTHITNENNINRAVKALNSECVSSEVESVIRVFN